MLSFLLSCFIFFVVVCFATLSRAGVACASAAVRATCFCGTWDRDSASDRARSMAQSGLCKTLLLFCDANKLHSLSSVSALQWLCNQDKVCLLYCRSVTVPSSYSFFFVSRQSENIPQRRLKRFFQTLYNSLSKGARAVFQFYPEAPQSIEVCVELLYRRFVVSAQETVWLSLSSCCVSLLLGASSPAGCSFVCLLV